MTITTTTSAAARPWTTLAAQAAVALSLALGASAASAAPCVAGPSGAYFAPGFSCSVGPMTFENFAASSSVIFSGGSVGVTGIGDISPFFSGNEFGLTLSFNNTAENGATLDFVFEFDVVGASGIADALLAFTASTTGSGQATASQALSNGSSLTLSAPGSTTTTFAAVPTLHVNSHQVVDAGSGATATGTSLTNAFSAVAPEPKSLALIGVALAGLGLSRRRRA